MGSGFLLHSRYGMKINSIDWSSAIHSYDEKAGWVRLTVTSQEMQKLKKKYKNIAFIS